MVKMFPEKYAYFRIRYAYVRLGPPRVPWLFCPLPQGDFYVNSRSKHGAGTEQTRRKHGADG